MPPALSDEENSDNEFSAINAPPRRASRANKSASYSDDPENDVSPGPKDDVNGHGDENEEDEEGDDDEEDEDEYVVEKILSHQFQGGELKFEVKWEGYEKKADRTWEPEDNLKENASDVLEEYFESVGGRAKIFEEMKNGLKNKKRGRPSAGGAGQVNKRSRRDDHPRNSSTPATAQSAQWKPPAGSWEEEIASLDACEDEETHKLMVYLTWKNGQRTQHETSVIYKRCPQKMLQFYERHVRIIKKDIEDPNSTPTPLHRP